MTLSQAQRIFSVKVAKLILWADSKGYGITLGEAWRPPETAALYAKQGRGVKNSIHEIRLGVDLNLFKDGAYTSKSEDYKPLGRFWENMAEPGIKTVWGGAFNDSGHFSVWWRDRA